jgi:hypothetical protein
MISIQKKILFYLAVIFMAANLCGQNNHENIIKKIESNTPKEVIKVDRLSNNYAPHIKNLYAITFIDKSTRIYDSDADTLSGVTYSSFTCNFGTYLGINNTIWHIFEESGDFKAYYWEQKASLNKDQFDSIKILYFDHFIGYKNDKEYLFYFKYNTDTLLGFNEINCDAHYIPHFYSNGIFIKTLPTDSGGKIAYIHYESGLPKSTMRADSILNYPNSFTHYSLIVKDAQLLVYSFTQNRIVEDSFSKHYIVPVYEYPLVVKDNYIAFGNWKWIQIQIDSVASVEFESFGDIAFAHATTQEGRKYIINLWEKEIINRRRYKRFTRPWRTTRLAFRKKRLLSIKGEH